MAGWSGFDTTINWYRRLPWRNWRTLKFQSLSLQVKARPGTPFRAMARSLVRDLSLTTKSRKYHQNGLRANPRSIWRIWAGSRCTSHISNVSARIRPRLCSRLDGHCHPEFHLRIMLEPFRRKHDAEAAVGGGIGSWRLVLGGARGGLGHGTRRRKAGEWAEWVSSTYARKSLLFSTLQRYGSGGMQIRNSGGSSPIAAEQHSIVKRIVAGRGCCCPVWGGRSAHSGCERRRPENTLWIPEGKSLKRQPQILRHTLDNKHIEGPRYSLSLFPFPLCPSLSPP